MRREDREVKDPGRIEEIIRSCYCCRVGFYDDGEIYIVPLSFGYSKSGETYTFYFHGAKAGRKYDLLQVSPKVGLEMDARYELCEAESPCAYSCLYQSIIASGKASVVADPEEKLFALQAIMNHTAGEKEWHFPPSAADSVCVFKVEAEKLSCKEHA